MDGILNINKPSGPTSFDVVAMVRRLSGQRHVGHAGTLDPTASGVLPVCLGRATRLVQFLVDTTKVYRAQIELGISTDTYDASGAITGTADASRITREDVEDVLCRFRGTIKQTPPMYSAVKYHGQPLYKLARAGIQVERQSRPACIHRLEIIECQAPLFTLDVECGKGTYIRSLAHDIGQVLGCGAHLKDLVRLRCGPFDVREAIPVSDLEPAFKYGYWENFIYPPDTILTAWNAAIVDGDARVTMSHGGLLALQTGAASQPYCRAYGLNGDFLGLLRFDAQSGQWHSHNVFIPSASISTQSL